jgi:uncharacterized repeat protein (TIGR01451 family)
MRRILGVLVLLLLMGAQITYVHSQEDGTVPEYMSYDEPIMIMREHLRQDRVELVQSYRVIPTEYFADVYMANPPDYFLQAPSGYSMQRPSDTDRGERIYTVDDIYMVVIYDFEHDLIIEAGEWKDLNGNFLAENNEWFDENYNGVREYGEWTDLNGNGIVDLNELDDANGNGVFDIGEWHEGKNTDLNTQNNLPGEFNGAVDPDEWIGMNRDRSITKKLALKIYKRLFDYYKEVDYREYISPTMPAKVFQHPALRAMTTLTDNQKLVVLLSLEECEHCEVVGDVAWYEDEYTKIVFNFQGFFRETLHTTLPRCDGCFEAQITYYANLQLYQHRKFNLLYDDFYLHNMESRGLPDNRDGTTAYYYTAGDEMSKEIRQLVSFDPYYLIIRNNNEMVLYETIYGKALIVPYEDKEEEYGSHIYTRKYPDGTEKDIRVELIHVYQIETIDCEQIIVARLLIDEDTAINNTMSTDEDEKIYTVFYYACDDRFENNIIFPEEYEEGTTDFAIIVEKIELETEKVHLKFVREVDSEFIPSPSAFPYGIRDFQAVFDELDRNRPLGACDYYPKAERHVPRFEEILVDVCLPIRDLLNNVVLKYEDLKGEPYKTGTMLNLEAYEEQPWEMTEWNTEVTLIQIKKIAYNPNAEDYTGLGYADIPVYAAPLNPAPGLVQVGPDLLPNFQITDEDFSGTCVPGDTIYFYIEIFNGSGGPMAVLVEDDIPAGMVNAAVGAPGVILDTNNDFIFGNGGDTIQWNFPALPAGYTLLIYQADVLADGTVSFGGSILNNECTVYYYDASALVSQVAPPITIEVEAARIVKEAFQDLACTIPAPVILPGSRLYYRLTVFNTIDPASFILFNANITEILDVIPPLTTGPQIHTTPVGFNPSIVGNTVSWTHAGFALPPGNSINAIYSVFVPIGSAGRILNDAQVTYAVLFPPPGGSVSATVSNIYETWIQTTPTRQPEPLEPCLTMSIEKTGPTTQATGVLAYRIIITNHGTGPYADAFNIVFIDKLPQYVSAPVFINVSNPAVVVTTHDSDGDGVDDVIMGKLDQLVAGDQITVDFNVIMGSVPYNCYALKVYTYEMYKKEEDRYLGMGAIARADQYKITPEDMAEVVTDAVFTQVMKGSEKLENYLIKLFESRIYDKEFFFEFTDFEEKERSARFKLSTSVQPDIDVNVYWGILEEVSMDSGLPNIFSDDTFLAHILLRNDGDGTASEISYEVDAPDFQPVDMTWIYNLEHHLSLEISPDEQAGLLFLMKAPSVSHETTVPIKVKITYSDGVKTRTDTKTVYLNVLSQRRASIQLRKTIIEGKSVVKETGKEVADMRVGEERTIVTHIRNLSEDEIEQVHYLDQIPQGLEVIEGDPEWMGTLKPGETVKVTYKIRVKQIGVYQFRGKTFYKDERDHVYEAVSNVTEIRVITDPGPKLRRELDSEMVTKGDTLTVVIRVENDTPNPIEHIQLVDIIPEGFHVEKLETKGLKEDEGTVRYYIDELKSNKYILLKYTMKAGEKAGKFTYKGVRLAYENGDGLKQEVVTEDHVVMIPEMESPSLQMSLEPIRKVDSDGEIITLSLDIPNMGGIAAKNIKIQTNLPEGTQYLEASTDYLQEGSNLTFLVDEIGAGERFNVKYTIKVPHFSEDRSYTLLYSVLYSDDFDREYSLNMESSIEVKSRKPSVKVTKVAEKSEVKLNFSLRVAVNVINEGEIPAVAHMVDPLPEGMVLLSGTNEWEGLLEPGESAQIIYEMLCTRVGSFLLPSATTVYQDKWKIAYTAESESALLSIKGIQVEKSVDVDALKIGDVVVVTVTVTNTYDERATNVAVKDSASDEFTLLDGDTSWNIGVLEPGEEVTFTYSLTPTVQGSFNLGAATATFFDVYNDKHESKSASISIMVEERKEEAEEREIPTEEIEEAVETAVERLARSFDITLILVIFLIMAVSMMMAFLLIERRRTEEETYMPEEIPPTPVEGELLIRPEEIRKPALPTPKERAEVMEEDTRTALDRIEERRERFKETKEEVEKVAKVQDVHELLETRESKGSVVEEPEEFEFGKEPEEFEFGEGLTTREIKREDLGLEDLFEEKELGKSEEAKFTDVREIMSRTREEKPVERETGSDLPEWTEIEQDEEMEIADIRELIKGPRKVEEKPEHREESEESNSDDFDPRGILKKKD